jgi:hypothetical protein
MSDGIKRESNTYDGKKNHRKMMYSRGQRDVFDYRHRDDGKESIGRFWLPDGVGSDRIGCAGSLT